MSKNILFLFILLLLGLSVFYSCDNNEYHDTIKPTVKVNQPSENDTLYLNKESIFEAIFQDDKGLSSYFIRVFNPNVGNDRVVDNPDNPGKLDSLLYLDQVIQRSNIFEIRDTAVTVKHTFILDSLVNYEGRGPYKIKSGVYQFKVVVMDMAGNKDSSLFDVNVAYPLVVTETPAN